MKIRQIISAAGLLMLTHAHAQTVDSQVPKTDGDSGSQAVQIPTLVTGIARKYTSVGKSLSSSCYAVDGKMLGAPTLFIVAGYESCKTSYLGHKGFFIAFHGAQKYYIAESDLELSEQEAATVKSLLDEQKTLFFSQAEVAAAYIRRKEISEVLDAFKRHKKVGLTVVSSEIADVSEHTDGTSFSIEVMNQAAKPIKYVWFTVVGYNAVGDPVRGRSGTSMTVKGIGPIAPGDSGSYEWEYLWHTDVVENFKIPKIKIQYMDGSMREVQNVKAITLSKSHRMVLKETDDS